MWEGKAPDSVEEEEEFEFELDVQEIPEGVEVFVIDDGEFSVEWYSDVCLFCKHYAPKVYQGDFSDWRARWKATKHCRAFDVIPDDIWNGQNKHTARYPGDKGYRFELRTEPVQRTE